MGHLENGAIWANKRVWLGITSKKARVWRDSRGRTKTRKQLQQYNDFLWLVKDGRPVDNTTHRSATNKTDILDKLDKTDIIDETDKKEEKDKQDFINSQVNKFAELYRAALTEAYDKGTVAKMAELHEKVYAEYQKREDSRPEGIQQEDLECLYAGYF